MSLTEQRFANGAQAAQALALAVASELQLGLDQRGAASLVVSGGRSPIPFFKALRQQPLDWARVSITLADERWVGTDSESSNEWLVREHLLQEAAAKATFVGLKTADINPIVAVSELTERLMRMPRPFDAVVLGMGTDGHTASLFPGMPALAAMLNPRWALQVATATAPTAPRERVTLTLRALTDTRRIFLAIEGDAKQRVYVAARDDGADYPVAAILRQRLAPVTVMIASA